MSVCAIIAEYNPLHEGHLYHIKRTRELLGGDTRLIAIMSGNVTQRGDFPVMLKSARTMAALKAGFDLVFELPARYSCAVAERFAYGGVMIAKQLGIITHLSFGAETPETLRSLADNQLTGYDKSFSLPGALVANSCVNHLCFTPNNTLAAEYLRALAVNAPYIDTVAVKREGSAHDDDTSSASAIRKKMLSGGDFNIPFSEIYENERLNGRAPVSVYNNERAILSYLRRLGDDEWKRVPDTGGGLAERLRNAARLAGTLDELYFLVKTKRYTLARIRRCVMAAFLGIPSPSGEPELRLLGIGKHGRELLAIIKAPIISKPADHMAELELESRITDQAALFMPKPVRMGTEWINGVTLLFD